MSGQRVVLAGGSGFLGRILARFLAARDYEVVILSRNPLRFELPGRQAHWDGRATSAWAEQLEGAQAVVNLAGRSVNCRYTEANRLAILDSRVEPTRVLGEAIGQCARPPRVWLNSSTATIYKHSFDRAMDEATGEIAATPEAKDAFSVEVALAWEAALERAHTPGTRKVALRPAEQPPLARVGCSRGCCDGWCGSDWAVPWRVAASLCPGYTKRTFAGQFNG